MVSAKIYGKVREDGSVEYSPKPKSKRTSNLWLNPEKMKEEGWYPVKQPTGSTPRGKKLEGLNTELVEEELVVTYNFADETLSEYKESLMSELLQNFQTKVFGLSRPLSTAKDNVSALQTAFDNYKSTINQINAAKSKTALDSIEVTFE